MDLFRMNNLVWFYRLAFLDKLLCNLQSPCSVFQIIHIDVSLGLIVVEASSHRMVNIHIDLLDFRFYY
jgi:hypothetical protein